MSDDTPSDGLRIVLVRPKSSENVGAAARAMKNFGLSELVLVAPRCRIDKSARALASHAGDVLDRATVAPDLGEALRGVRWAIILEQPTRPRRGLVVPPSPLFPARDQPGREEPRERLADGPLADAQRGLDLADTAPVLGGCDDAEGLVARLVAQRGERVQIRGDVALGQFVGRRLAARLESGSTVCCWLTHFS